MTFDVIEPSYLPASNDLSMRLDLSLFSKLPITLRRDGKEIETFKVAVSDDPEYLRQAEADGYFAMSRDEASSQVGLMQNNIDMSESEGLALELNELKAANSKRNIDQFAPVGSDTLRTTLPKMHEENKPRQPTIDGHYGLSKSSSRCMAICP